MFSSKQEIINELESARADILDALDGLAEEQMLMPGAAGLWSVKDILAHLTAWESELITALNKAQGRGVPRIAQIEDIDAWNDEQYRANAARPIPQILQDFAGVHVKLIDMVRDYPQDMLLDGRRFEWMEGEALSYLIEENATLHEREHAENIRAWRAGLPS